MRIVRFEHTQLGYVADPFLRGIVVEGPHIDVGARVEEEGGTVWWTLRHGHQVWKFDLEDHLGEQTWEDVWMHLERRRKGERIVRRWFDVAGVLVPGVYAEYRHLDDEWDELYLSSIPTGVDVCARLDRLAEGAATYGGGDFDVDVIIDTRCVSDRA